MKPVILAGAICALALTHAAKAAPASDAAQIRAQEARFAEAFGAKNLDAIMRLYAPDVRVFDVAPPREYVGAAAYRADWNGVLAMAAGPYAFTLSDLRVETSGDFAWSTSIQTPVWTDAKGGSHSVTVRVTDVWRKRGGVWRIVHEHVSVPVDLMSGQADLASAP
jgi:ketosteroid isomerase-like protein